MQSESMALVPMDYHPGCVTGAASEHWDGVLRYTTSPMATSTNPTLPLTAASPKRGNGVYCL